MNFRESFSKELVKENDKMWFNLGTELNEGELNEGELSEGDLDELVKNIPEEVIYFMLHKDGFYQYSLLNPRDEYGVWKDEYKDFMVDLVPMSKEASLELFKN